MTPQAQVEVLKEHLQQPWLTEMDRRRYEGWLQDFENKAKKVGYYILIQDGEFKIFLPGFADGCKVKLKKKYLNNPKNF